MAGAPDGLRQPERVQPDAAAHIEAAGTLGQAEIGDDPSGLGRLKAIHALERLLRSFAFAATLVTHVITSPDRSRSAMVPIAVPPWMRTIAVPRGRRLACLGEIWWTRDC